MRLEVDAVAMIRSVESIEHLNQLCTDFFTVYRLFMFCFVFAHALLLFFNTLRTKIIYLFNVFTNEFIKKSIFKIFLFCFFFFFVLLLSCFKNVCFS